MAGRSEFRQTLVQHLNQGLDTFEMVRVRAMCDVSDDDARQASRDVFFSQCLKAADDWTISDKEQQVLRRLGERLKLSATQQEECLAAAKNRVFEVELKDALDDEMISSSEANSLAHLRKALGLAPMEAEEFGPAEPKPQKRRRKKPEKTEKRSVSHDDSPRQAWPGPWGPLSPVLGIPYTILVLSFAGCLLGGAAIASSVHDWRPLLASPVVAILIIASAWIGSHCWHCGSSWCLSRTYDYDDIYDYGFFGMRTGYLYYECHKCGGIKAVRKHRSGHRRAPWDFWC